MERLIQFLDEVDEVVGLAVLGLGAHRRQLAVQAGLLAVAVAALLVPV